MYQEVLKFWFEDATPEQWFRKDDKFDRLITARFSELHRRAAHCELYEWRREARGRLAEIIILDQFSRNMFRNTPKAFAQDALALALAQEAMTTGADQVLDPQERGFLYMPYMHSESPEIHRVAEQIFRQHGNETKLDYELKHKAIIDRFGRYPHRNAILGRASTPEEAAFLQQAGTGF
jgi:uncharacterized protein (DUF924 family)